MIVHGTFVLSGITGPIHRVLGAQNNINEETFIIGLINELQYQCFH